MLLDRRHQGIGMEAGPPVWSLVVLLRARWPKCFPGFDYPAENLCLDLLSNSYFDATLRSPWLFRHDICRTPLDAFERLAEGHSLEAEVASGCSSVAGQKRRQKRCGTRIRFHHRI